jgi:hypothetical protein
MSVNSNTHPSTTIRQSEITVTRGSSVWLASGRNGRNRALIMTLPEDVAELVGIKAGDKLLVTGSADGHVRIVKADRI